MRWHLAATTLIIAPIAVGAQQQGVVPAAAVQTATNFLRAVERADWRVAAGFLDSASIEATRREALAEASFPRHEPSAAELQHTEPDMPPAVADYMVARMKHHLAEYSPIANEFANLSSADSLRTMRVADVGARWLEASDERFRMRRALDETKRHGCAGVSVNGIADSAIKAFTPHYAVLGGFDASPGAAPQALWVAYEDARFASRADSAGAASEPPKLMRLRQVGGEWKVVARYELLSGSGMLSFSSGCETQK